MKLTNVESYNRAQLDALERVRQREAAAQAEGDPHRHALDPVVVTVTGKSACVVALGTDHGVQAVAAGHDSPELEGAVFTAWLRCAEAGWWAQPREFYKLPRTLTEAAASPPGVPEAAASAGWALDATEWKYRAHRLAAWLYEQALDGAPVEDGIELWEALIGIR